MDGLVPGTKYRFCSQCGLGQINCHATRPRMATYIFQFLFGLVDHLHELLLFGIGKRFGERARLTVAAGVML